MSKDLILRPPGVALEDYVASDVELLRRGPRELSISDGRLAFQIIALLPLTVAVSVCFAAMMPGLTWLLSALSGLAILVASNTMSRKYRKDDFVQDVIEDAKELGLSSFQPDLTAFTSGTFQDLGRSRNFEIAVPSKDKSQILIIKGSAKRSLRNNTTITYATSEFAVWDEAKDAVLDTIRTTKNYRPI